MVMGCGDVGEKGWEAVMFTIEELATVPLFSALGEKELEYLAGTVQEVFRAATMTFYGTDGGSGPFVFLGRDYWTARLPVQRLLRPLLAISPLGDLAGLIHMTDDVHEAAELVLAHS